MASAWKDIGRYGSVGIEFVLTILIVSWVGYWLDGRYWGGHGRGLVGGFVVGVAVAFRNLFRTARQMQRDIERTEAGDPLAKRWTVDPEWLHDEAPSPEPPAPADEVPPTDDGPASPASRSTEPK